ncbi:MAG: MarC family protein [Dehalococcoidia bacterium]
MSDFGQLLVAFFAVVNPAAVLLAARSVRRDGTPIGPPIGAGAALLAVALIAVLAVTGERILDGLAVAPESFRVAAGIVFAASGMSMVWLGRHGHAAGDGTWRDAISPLGLPLLFGPATLVAAVSYGADEGPGRTIAAATICVVAAGVLLVAAGRVRPALPDAIARLTGALLVVVAAGLVVDGVRAI